MSAPAAQAPETYNKNNIHLGPQHGKCPFSQYHSHIQNQNFFPVKTVVRVQCFQCTELAEHIYCLKRKYSLYLPNRCDYLLWLITEGT